MARITVEDCLDKEGNRFALVLLAAKRTKQLLQGAKPKIADTRSNKAVVVSLREIADGAVRFMTPEEAAKALELGIEDTFEPADGPFGAAAVQNGEGGNGHVRSKGDPDADGDDDI